MSSRKARKAPQNDHIDDVPLVKPSADGKPQTETLYEIAAERHGGLYNAEAVEIINADMNEDGTLSTKATTEHSQATGIERIASTALYAVSLTMVHFTFDVLVHQQYRQEIGWDLIASRTASAFPILGLLIYIFHWRAQYVWTQVLFLVGAVVAGCYIVHASNRYAYYAIMQRAPPLGTLWIWCVVELEILYATISLAAVGVFFIWGGYTMR